MMALILCGVTLALWASAATVLLKRLTGASGATTLNDITSANTTLNAFDAAADGVAHPIQIPAAGANYSYWGVIRMVCSVAPVTAINNIYVYSDGTNSLPSGVGCNLATAPGTNGNVTTNYTRATGVAGVTGLVISGANYPNSTTPTNFFSYTSAAPLALAGGFTTGVDSAANSNAGTFADWLLEQVTVASTASTTGTTATETVTFVWDEF